MNRFSCVRGTGSYLPPNRVSNAELVAELARRGVESSDEWIVERTGIRARHFVADGVFFERPRAGGIEESAGCCRDGRRIVGFDCRGDVYAGYGFSVNGGNSPTQVGVAGCPAFDVQAVCSGFVYAMTVADSMIRSGSANRVLVVGAEVFSRLLDFNDRTTCVLFGDGAGAVVMEASGQPGVLATDLHADGRHVGILCVPGHVSGGAILGDPMLKMDGQAVFKLADRGTGKLRRTVLARAGLDSGDVDWLIPHQANIRIMQSTARKLRISMDKVVVTVDQHGNTSAASIPLALDCAVRDGRVHGGDRVLLEGVGGGFTWGSVLLQM